MKFFIFFIYQVKNAVNKILFEVAISEQSIVTHRGIVNSLETK